MAPCAREIHVDMPSLVTLTTDFGEREPFVAAVKGVLYTRCPGIQVVDLSHGIPRHAVMEAALFLARAIPYFPRGTVHLVGVSPGPAPIAVSINGQHIVCADNGVVTILAERHGLEEKWSVNAPEEAEAQGGQTFFARDVFAPVAARLAVGTRWEELGAPLEKVTLLDVPRPKKDSEKIVTGQIMHVDRFGNLITNIHSSFLEGLAVTHVEVGLFPIGPLRRSYGDVPEGKPLALFGSAGYLEIAYNRDRADSRLEMGREIIVKLSVQPEA
jgi:S-adenosylmethionine hydrolase